MQLTIYESYANKRNPFSWGGKRIAFVFYSTKTTEAKKSRNNGEMIYHTLLHKIDRMYSKINLQILKHYEMLLTNNNSCRKWPIRKIYSIENSLI